MINDYDEEIKYKRRKESNVSKSNKKSNHKHVYEDCLLLDEKYKSVHKAQYCKICGKINHIKFFDFSPLENEKFLQLLSNDERLEKYKDLKHFKVKDIFNEKFVKF